MRSILLLVLLVSDVAAWSGHPRLTREALREVTWIDEHGEIPVTPFEDRIAGINPAYRFTFHGEEPGQTISAREILIRYSEEPDWGMDQELNVSWQQRFMGGYTGFSSQGYFHMYYPAFTVHLPIPGIPMGAAPQRTALWYAQAAQAFERGDRYWGFRYLACALHYIQDVAQPYHSTQTTLRFLDPRSPINGTTRITQNYHFVYEGWIERQLDRELAGEIDHGLVTAVRGATTVTYDTIEKFVKKVAARSHGSASPLLKACLDFYDPRFRQPVEVPATDQDHDQLEPAEARGRIVAATLPALELTGQSMRGFLQLAREQLITPLPMRIGERARAFVRLHDATEP